MPNLLLSILTSPTQMRDFLKGRIGLQALFREGIVAIDKEGLGLAEFPSGMGREAAHFDMREYFQGSNGDR